MDETEWLIESIQSAKSIERLRFLAWVIRCDQEHGFDWSKDQGYMEQVRQEWKTKREQLTSYSK